jgi:hypothetical protein
MNDRILIKDSEIHVYYQIPLRLKSDDMAENHGSMLYLSQSQDEHIPDKI